MSIHARTSPEDPGQDLGIQITNPGTSLISHVLQEGLEPEVMAQEPMLTSIETKASSFATFPSGDPKIQKDAASAILEKAVEVALGQKLQSPEVVISKIKEGKIEELATHGLSLATLRDAEGNSLIHLALKEDWPLSLNIIKELCKLGCDVNAQDIDGQTPLHKSIQSSDFAVTSYLLDQGGNIHIRDNIGATAAQLLNTRLASPKLTRMIDKRVDEDGSQTWLLTPMRDLGYIIDNKGMCYGIGHMAMQAILANDVTSFNQRVIKIRNLDSEEFNKDVPLKSAEEKQERADTLAFCDGISLYHHPNKYKQFVEHQGILQNAELIAQEIAPVDLVKNEGQIVQASISTSLFTDSELKFYFEKMAEACADAPCPIALSLIGNNHDICLGYFPDKNEWCLFDVNKPPLRVISNLDQLTSAVLECLSASNDSHICLTSQIYTTERNQQAVQHSLAQAKIETASITEVTEAKATVITRTEKTWLTDAASMGNLNTVQALLKHKADVNYANEEGITALFMAVQNGHIEVVKLLLDNNAEANKATVEGRTALHTASYNGNTEIVKLLLEKGADKEKLTNIGVSPLIFAAETGMTQTVQTLLDAAADVDSSASDLITPLAHAASNGHTGVVKILLENNADINKSTADNATALLRAAQAGNVEIVKLLLENKADVNKAFSDVITPLFLAVLNRHYEVARLLLEYDADVNKPNGEDLTPMMQAVQNEDVEMVKLLLSKKPDLSMESIEGYNAREMAFEKTYDSNSPEIGIICDLLLDAEESNKLAPE